MVIFPLVSDQTIAQIWSNGARGVSLQARTALLSYTVVFVFLFKYRETKHNTF